MKRYQPEADTYGWKMVRDPDGDWVQRKDVEHLAALLAERNNVLQAAQAYIQDAGRTTERAWARKVLDRIAALEKAP